MLGSFICSYMWAPSPKAQVHRESCSEATWQTCRTSCPPMRRSTSRATPRPSKHASRGKRLIRIPICVTFWVTTQPIWRHGLPLVAVSQRFDETLQVGNSGSPTTKDGWPIRRSHFGFDDTDWTLLCYSLILNTLLVGGYCLLNQTMSKQNVSWSPWIWVDLHH